MIPSGRILRAEDISFGAPRTELGRGAFGVVYKATWQHSTVAVKQVIIPAGSGSGGAAAQQAVAEMAAEAATLSRLSHPHVVTFHGLALDGPAPMLVTEFVGGGTLYDQLYKPQPPLAAEAPFGAAARRRVVREIAAGCVHLHDAAIVHRDLKPGNILLTAGTLSAKVADFGLSRLMKARGAAARAPGAGGPGVGGGGGGGTLVFAPDGVGGTVLYLSPEAWLSEPLTAKSDVYAIGIIVNEVRCRFGMPSPSAQLERSSHHEQSSSSTRPRGRDAPPPFPRGRLRVAPGDGGQGVRGRAAGAGRAGRGRRARPPLLDEQPQGAADDARGRRSPRARRHHRRHHRRGRSPGGARTSDARRTAPAVPSAPTATARVQLPRHVTVQVVV